MVPLRTNEKWKALVSGEMNHSFKCVPAGLMLSRLKRESQKDNSMTNINNLIDEAYNFFIKYESILTEDIKEIFK
jgi:hypothetical protein